MNWAKFLHAGSDAIILGQIANHILYLWLLNARGQLQSHLFLKNALFRLYTTLILILFCYSFPKLILIKIASLSALVPKTNVFE